MLTKPNGLRISSKSEKCGERVLCSLHPLLPMHVCVHAHTMHTTYSGTEEERCTDKEGGPETMLSSYI